METINREVVERTITLTKDSKNVLVADDSVFFRTRLSDILIEAGHKVRFAKNGREVINEIGINSQGIDLLVLDLQMPDVDGFAVLKWIDENGHRDKFPVLVVTGVHEPANVIEGLKNFGATGLMSKGSTPEQIIFRINRVLFPEKSVKGANPRERVPVSIPVDFTLGNITRTGFLLNLSARGAYLNTKSDLLSGSVLQLKFSLPGSEEIIEIEATVKWSTNDPAKSLFGGYGIMFSSITPKDLKTLKGFIEKETNKLGDIKG